MGVGPERTGEKKTWMSQTNWKRKKKQLNAGVIDAGGQFPPLGKLRRADGMQRAETWKKKRKTGRKSVLLVALVLERLACGTGRP